MRNKNTTDVSNDQPLVTTPISQRDTLELYPRSLRVKRPNTGKTPDIIPDRSGTNLSGFSSKSRSRLRFMAVNATPALVSQFGLTYHNDWPTDGRQCKKHLNTFLQFIRRNYPNVNYLWIMEFQKRNAPHFHLFLTIEPNSEMLTTLARAWSRITSPNDQLAEQFHANPKNWILWEMNNANYLAKYLDKDAQKTIPEGYSNFGRFWGNSRNLLQPPIEIPLENLETLDQVDKETGEITDAEKLVIRWLGKLAEKQTNGYSRFRTRAHAGSYTILNGSTGYRQIERYLSKERTK